MNSRSLTFKPNDDKARSESPKWKKMLRVSGIVCLLIYVNKLLLIYRHFFNGIKTS